MGIHITANELKTKGVTALREATREGGEAVISVRGRDEYVVLPMASYHRLRECELEAALVETRQDLKDGKYHRENAKQHVKRIRRG